MFLDNELLLSDAQTLTTGSENGIASTNVVDLGTIRNVGVGQPLYFVCQVDTALADTGSNSTLDVILQSDDNSGFNSAVTAQTIGTFAATAAAGTRLVGILQPDKINERYVRAFYTAQNGALSACQVTSFITDTLQAYNSYADGITIA